MKIKISGLKNGTHTFRFEGNTENLDLIEPLNGNYIADVVLNKNDNQIILEVEASVEADFICDRCSTEYKGLVQSNYEMVYIFNTDTDEKNDESNITYLLPETDKIDITYDIRDYLILSIPMKKLCKEDCAGLCIKCGKDLNEGPCECKDEEIDDRWKSLIDLKKKLNNN